MNITSRNNTAFSFIYSSVSASTLSYEIYQTNLMVIYWICNI